MSSNIEKALEAIEAVNKSEKPARSAYTKVWVTVKGKLVFEGLHPDWLEAKSSLVGTRKDYVLQQDVDNEAWDAARTAYRMRQLEALKNLKLALFEENGVTDNPKAEAAYSLCKDNTSNLTDLLDNFDRYADLIK